MRQIRKRLVKNKPQLIAEVLRQVPGEQLMIAVGATIPRGIDLRDQTRKTGLLATVVLSGLEQMSSKEREYYAIVSWRTKRFPKEKNNLRRGRQQSRC